MFLDYVRSINYYTVSDFKLKKLKLMGRYRPPQPKGSCYITPQGKATLSEELSFLWHKRRPEVVKALSAAAAEGDRSENAEYIYRKKELREIDSRVRYLTKRLEELKVVDSTPDDISRIYFGAWVEQLIAEGKLNKFFKESCLMNQQYVKEPDKTIADYLNEVIAKTGEKITIKRFARFQIGAE